MASRLEYSRCMLSALINLRQYKDIVGKAAGNPALIVAASLYKYRVQDRKLRTRSDPPNNASISLDSIQKFISLTKQLISN